MQKNIAILAILGTVTLAACGSKTDAAKLFAQEREVASIGLNGKTSEKQTDLCWGKKALDKIVKWEGPIIMLTSQGWEAKGLD